MNNQLLFFFVILTVVFILYIQYKIDKWITDYKSKKLNYFQSSIKMGDTVLHIEYDEKMHPVYKKIILRSSVSEYWDFSYLLPGHHNDDIGVDIYECYPLDWNESLLRKFIKLLKQFWVYIQTITSYQEETSKDIK